MVNPKKIAKKQKKTKQIKVSYIGGMNKRKEQNKGRGARRVGCLNSFFFGCVGVGFFGLCGVCKKALHFYCDCLHHVHQQRKKTFNSIRYLIVFTKILQNSDNYKFLLLISIVFFFFLSFNIFSISTSLDLMTIN